ncbi:hypothetical protein [Vibrio sp. Hal054]|uniref:hypothetical protein n=1 Tax=Vibrio sp. Hal054 TaxID=3035158 RepID=UPI00301CB8B9
MNDKDDALKDELDYLVANPSRSNAFNIIYAQLINLYKLGYVASVGTLGRVVIKPLPLTDPKIIEIQDRWDLPQPNHTSP